MPSNLTPLIGRVRLSVPGFLLSAVAVFCGYAETVGKMSDQFPSIFAELRSLMLEAAPGMVITEDTPTTFTLKTPWIEAGTKQPAWFGWIAIKKSYVAYHVMPLYVLSELEASVAAELTKRRQGKSCFNVKKANDEIYEALRKLTIAAHKMEPAMKAKIGS